MRYAHSVPVQSTGKGVWFSAQIFFVGRYSVQAFPALRAGEACALALLLVGPLGSDEGWEDQAPSGAWAWMPMPFRQGRSPVEKPLPPFMHLAPAKRSLGVPFSFGYFSLGTQRKVTRVPTALESAAGNVQSTKCSNNGLNL
ncbi:hypothetical protein [Dyella caseinilytica]|uniref:Uncharacterized protein n=1 Tax=Dyella caseinilytica TaxID=1849581 RepID=A0ABX7GYI3_9GAMM|nr:hypothetical protein [Dyella caseinilytica]QRN54894.1 hypothetical protein ISN74_05955 [Dyella caseinilytica]GFZ97740.1 hypothetical protein GCM10011408_17800 [Dyella caseinilytica]